MTLLDMLTAKGKFPALASLVQAEEPTEELLNAANEELKARGFAGVLTLGESPDQELQEANELLEAATTENQNLTNKLTTAESTVSDLTTKLEASEKEVGDLKAKLAATPGGAGTQVDDPHAESDEETEEILTESDKMLQVELKARGIK